MQRELLAEAAAGADTRSVLELVVELIESQVPGAVASVLLADRDTQTLSTFVAPRLPPEYNDASKLEALPRGYLASKRRSYRCHYLAV